MNTIASQEESLLLKYYRYRAYIMPIIVLVISIVLCIEVLIPQIQNWLMVQNDIKTHQDKVQTLTEDLNTLSGINEAGLDTDLQTTSAALPTGLDFLTVVSVINQAGINAGVSVSDYTVQNSSSAENTHSIINSMQMSVTIIGDIHGVQKFITEIKKQLPLADVTTIDTSDKNASIGLAFFYKPFPNIQFNDNESVQQLSPSEEGLITKLSNYQNSSLDNTTPPLTTSQ